MPLTVSHTFVTAASDEASPGDRVQPSHWNQTHTVDWPLPPLEIAGVAGSSAIAITGATQTASFPLISATQTWNNGAVTFKGLDINITDTASAAGSVLADFRVGGTSKASFRKDGLLTLAGDISLSSDLFLSRAAAASLRLGAADAASPVAQTLGVQSVVAGTTNTAGQNFTIKGSAGTGNAAGGSLIFQVAPAGASGTAQNGFATALTIDSTKLATFAGNVSVGNDLLLPGSLGAKINFGSGYGSITRGNTPFAMSFAPDSTLNYTAAVRNATNSMLLHVYHTSTDASNFQRAAIQNGADYVELAAETAGTGAANMDVRLTPAGTGNVRFGAHSAIGAEIVSGYIPIKDAAGNVRKLAVVS